MQIRITIKLNTQEINDLMRPVHGQGGFQNFMRALQSRLNPLTGNTWLNPRELVRLYRYMSKGQGGFQGRFQSFLPIVKEITDACVEAHTS